MIKKIDKNDKDIFISLAKEFYSSPAVLHSIPDSHFSRTFEELTASNTYTQGYLFYNKNQVAGYALIAKTFSQEAGGFVIWIEELYIKPEFQNNGFGTEFFKYLERTRSDDTKRLRLEVDNGNVKAAALYKRLGFTLLEYKQYIKDFK